MDDSSPNRRRERLQRLRSEDGATGPLAQGLRESDYYVAASFFSPYVCKRFRRSLTAAGVLSVTRKVADKWTGSSVRFARRAAGASP